MNMNKEDITYAINGCAMKVHRYLGSGFQEVIYQRALAIEFQNAGLNFVREQEHEIYYYEIEVGVRRADFVVDDRIIVELKAVTELLPTHIIQVKNYLTAYHKPIGLLINFGQPSLKFHKIFPNNFKSDFLKPKK